MQRAFAILIILPWVNPFSPGPAPTALPFLFSWACSALALYCFTWVPASPGSILKHAAPALLVAAMLNASIGLFQYFGAVDWAGVWFDHPVLGQAYGNLRQRNQYATLLNIGLAVSFWWAAQSTRRYRVWHVNVSSEPLLVSSSVLLGVGSAASSSRTGLIQLILVCCLAMFWQYRSRRSGIGRRPSALIISVVFISLIAYALATITLPWMAGLDPASTGAWSRLRNGDAPCSSRATLWINVLHLISLKPWWGWGWGELDYAHFVTLYPGTRFCDILDNAHNLPLHIAVEFGIPAAVLLCAAVIWLFRAQPPISETNPDRQLAWSVISAIGIHSLLEYPLWYGPFQTACLLSLWCLLQPGALASEQQTLLGVTKARLRSAVTIFTCLVLAACAFAAWQYQLASQIYLPPKERMAPYKENTLEKIRGITLYQDQVRFAELTTTDLDADNAKAVNALAKRMLHFSPEPSVIEQLLDSATLLGHKDEVAYYSERYKVAFPERYAQWQAKKHNP